MGIECLERRDLLASSEFFGEVDEPSTDLLRSIEDITSLYSTALHSKQKELGKSSVASQQESATTHRPPVVTNGFAAADLPGISFEAAQPLGSLIYQGSLVGLLRNGEIDTLTLDVGAGQTITVAVEAINLLSPSITLEGPPDDPFIVSATSTETSETAIIQTQPAHVGGTYRISIAGSGRDPIASLSR